MKIRDSLTLNLSEDIKNVIDLEDISEIEIQSEIENYIITDGLAKEYVHFVSAFTSNLTETGVWISGFYGSGKSYFGKLLGYMLSNLSIGGTPARDRIMHRFTGISDEALVKNSVSRLATENCRVVFLDVAKQNTSKGLAFTLFRNFLKSLNLPENEHGFFLYQLMINSGQTNVYEFIKKRTDNKWDELKTRLVEYAKVIKTIYIDEGNTSGDYDNIMTTIRRDIDQFSASRLSVELQNYLKINKEEKIVMLFDEASEAINQKKFDLLDLEGISEALSSLGGAVWTIAIAQEKLDEVINNSNVSKAQLTKVTDRFKTKIHLESTEVDVIIRNRLLNKNETAIKKLRENYSNNSGKITDHAALNATGITKTDSVESYITYYPFYKYQFDLLQNFLFGTKGYASTKVAARGMIITTFDILKRELQEEELFEVATGWQIAKQAQPQPPVRLVNRYENAERILKNCSSIVNGRQLLETINFLKESESAPTTLSNIIKSFINDAEEYHKIQNQITSSLKELVEAKILLYINNEYRITSDIEERMLDEMSGFDVKNYVKRSRAVEAYKSSVFIKRISRIVENNLSYDFHILTDNDDELTKPQMKKLKIRIKSLYNISDDRSTDIESIKVQYQNDKDCLWIVPNNDLFKEIDRLIDEIERISYLEDKYPNPQVEEAEILRGFLTTRSSKMNSLKDLIDRSFQNCTSIYLYDTCQLDKDNWQITLENQQKKVIQNVFDRRLLSQLTDDVAGKVIKEANETRLKTYFTGSEFRFFDGQGNFIGENLKVTEEIVYKFRNTFVDGTTLERDLEEPPTGFTFGTIISTVAALMRAGKVIVKYNGSEKFSWRDEGVKEIFANAREFRKTSFKAISKSLSAQQKNDIVTTLRDLDCEEYLEKKIDWNTNDFDLVNSIRNVAKRFCDKVEDMKKQNKAFETLFGEINEHKDFLSEFTGAVSESNYIEKAENYLNNREMYGSGVLKIEKVEKFIRNNLPELLKWKTFVSDIKDELIKSGKNNEDLRELLEEFDVLFSKEIVKNYKQIQKITQEIKDEYYKLMKDAAKEMVVKYSQIKTDAEKLIKEIEVYPFDSNDSALYSAKNILTYAIKRANVNIEIDYDVKDNQSHFTYSEILSFIELYNTRKTDLNILQANIVKEPPKDRGYDRTKIKTISINTPVGNMKVCKYRKWLEQELQNISNLEDNEEIEVKKG